MKQIELFKDKFHFPVINYLFHENTFQSKYRRFNFFSKQLNFFRDQIPFILLDHVSVTLEKRLSHLKEFL